MTSDPKPSSSHKLSCHGHRVLFLEKGYDLLDENVGSAARKGQSDDESFFPSSSGTNPSLTISSNALRAATRSTSS